MDQALEIKILKQLSSDTALQKDLSNCKTPDQLLKVLKNAGFDVSLNDLKGSMKKLGDILDQPKEELTESDLEMVAGGKSGASGLLGIIIATKKVLKIIHDILD